MPLIFSYSYHSSLIAPIETEFEDDLLGSSYADSFTTRILNAKYEEVNIHDVAFD